MPKYTEEQLQNAMKHARREPTASLPGIAALYQVNITTLRRRVAGKQVSNSVAKRNKQLFSPGEEKAIAEHCGVMADLGFPVTKDVLQRIAQDMLNSRNQPSKGKGDLKVSSNSSLASSSSSLPSGKAQIVTDRRANQIRRQGASSDIHVVGAHWVDRFLKRNSKFKKQYVRYQERARKAAENDEESQAHFLRLLGNLTRRLNILYTTAMRRESLWDAIRYVQ